MKKWEGPAVPEEDMTAEQREEAVRRAREQREREYEWGRKVFTGMLIFFVASEILSIILGMFAFSSAAALSSYMISGGVSIILVLVLTYYLYHGRTGARIIFGILLVYNILMRINQLTVVADRAMLVMGFLNIAISLIYLYIVFGYQPVREFLYGQSAE
ncbi:MAG: hypothetical protein K2N94_10115 [Lachnospiraceae bacterium]|nr:hypothetical protein [Lachnospiraceae bacterium]